ncbi:MAG: hypothetical protein ABI273_18780 [Lacunisphaera sp.]
MKIGGGFYQNGKRIGDLVYVGAFAMRDSRHPQFLTADKATQFSVIVNTSLPRTSDFSSHEWAMGESNAIRPVRIITCHYDTHRTVLVVEVLPPS